MFFKKAPALAFERKLKGLDKYELRWAQDVKQACLGNVPFLSDYPDSFPDRLDRVLLNIARRLDFDPTLALSDASFVPAMFFVEPDLSNEIDYLPTMRAMISVLQHEGFVGYHHDTYEHENLHLTYQGVVKALELHRKISQSKRAFLAMWFDPSLTAYRKAVENAVRAAGYDLLVVNEVHHNDYIMDKVLNLITESRFLIADLTCAPEEVRSGKPSKGVRGGVYLEAGYAKGLGKQVIFTCKEDIASQDRIHFDVKQVNTIFWSEDADRKVKAFSAFDFIEYLEERIVATVGRGPRERT
ncbi:MAG: hypothetical protein PHU80_03860 [Kiritimatiellae bacterium]|nr:hypothetical protein [Kiritimatiellia bacterium]